MQISVQVQLAVCTNAKITQNTKKRYKFSSQNIKNLKTNWVMFCINQNL